MKIAVLIPYGNGTVESKHLACIEALMQTRKVERFGAEKDKVIEFDFIRSYGCSQLNIARDSLATKALDDTNADVFVWIDHDTIFDVKDFFLLAEHCLQGPYEILGGLYAKRMPGKGYAAVIPPKVKSVEFFTPGLIPAVLTGMGFTAIQRKVFEVLAEKYPKVYASAAEQDVHPFFLNFIDDAGFYLSEDESFCRRATEQGFNIGIDTEPRLGHRGPYNYTLEDGAIVVPRYDRLTINFSPVRENNTGDNV